MFGSFVLPLALKIEVQRIGEYSLTEEDRLQIDMFEEQTLHDHFSEHDDQDYPWLNVVREFRKRRRIVRAIERCQGDSPTS